MSVPFLVIIIGTILLYSTPTASQAVCGDRAEIVARLESAYQEKVVAVGMAGTGNVVELFLSTRGSWTLLLTQPIGISCLIAAGDNWEFIMPPKLEKPTHATFARDETYRSEL